MVKRLAWRTGVAAATLVVLGALVRIAAGGGQQAARLQEASGRPLTFFIADGDRDTGYRVSDRELAGWAFEAWARSAAGALRLETALEQEAVVRLYWSAADGSYGEMRPIVVGGRRGAAIFVRPDIEALGPDIAERARQDPLWRDAIVYLTCLHELGHALGLAHTADERDIMYFFGYGGDIVEYFGRYRRQLTSRSDIATASGLSDADVRRLRALHPAP